MTPLCWSWIFPHLQDANKEDTSAGAGCCTPSPILTRAVAWAWTHLQLEKVRLLILRWDARYGVDLIFIGANKIHLEGAPEV